MAKMFNRARMTVTSTGTGALSLGVAVAGYQTFSSAGAQNNDVVSYAVEDGLKWEIGTGTYNSVAGTLSRTVTQSFDGTTYGTAAISVTTSAQVFISPLAADLQYGTSAGNLVQLDGSAKIPAVDGSQLTNLNAANIASGTLGVARGGTGLTSLTAGYIPFGAGTSAFGNDANLFWDNTNKLLGIGTSSPSYKIDISAANDSTARVRLVNTTGYNLFWSSNTGGGTFFGTEGSAGGAFMSSTPAYASVITSTTATPLCFGVNTTEAMRIASGGSVGIGYTTTSGIGANGLAVLGNVGIGTASPSGKFTVSGGRSHFVANSEIYALSVGYASIGAYYLGANSANNSLLISNSGGTTVATFDNAGNLGLGVTPSAWASPFTKAFEIGTVGSIATTTNSLRFANNAYYGSLSWTYKNTAAAAHYDIIDNTHSWYNANSGTAGTAITFTQAMTLDGSGNLGVGTSSPGYKLHVSSASDMSGRFETTGTTNAASFFLASGNGTTSGKYAYARFLNNDTNAQEWRLGTYGDNNFTIYDAKAVSARLTIDTSGNVGIGTTSPSATLHVKGGSTNNLKIDNGGQQYTELDFANNGTIKAYYYWDNTNSNFVCQTAVSASLTFGTNGSPRATIDSSGNVGIGTSSPATRLEIASPASTSAVFRISSNKTGAGAGDRCRWDNYSADNSGVAYQLGFIDFDRADTTGTSAYMAINTRVSGTVSERARIDSSGNLLVGTTTTGGGKVCVKNTPSSQWGIDFNECEISVANNSNATLPTGSGMVIINDPVQSGALGVYLFGGSTVVKVSSTDGTFVNPTTTPGAGTASIQSSSGTYRIYNNIGQTITFKVAMLRTRNSN